MIYEYHCPGCSRAFDVVKSYKDMEREEHCPECEVVSIRKFVPSRIHLMHTSVQNAEFNPGLGCVTNSREHVKEICKERGLEEVGSEPVANIHKHYDQRREEKIEKIYEDVTRGWVGDGSS